ncbi:MAG: RNA polymerase sigma factor [Panacagrimonas sp.]
MTGIETSYPLIRSAQDGDRRAMEQLLATFQPDLRRYAQRHCFITDIDDAIQETLLIVSRKLPAVRVLASFSAWLFSIVKRECRRATRKALRFDPWDEALVEQWIAHSTPETQTLEVVEALQSLPADYLEIVLLRDYSGLTLEEIATKLRLSLPAAKSRLHRARQLARDHLLGRESLEEGLQRGNEAARRPPALDFDGGRDCEPDS